MQRLYTYFINNGNSEILTIIYISPLYKLSPVLGVFSRAYMFLHFFSVSLPFNACYFDLGLVCGF